MTSTVLIVLLAALSVVGILVAIWKNVNKTRYMFESPMQTIGKCASIAMRHDLIRSPEQMTRFIQEEKPRLDSCQRAGDWDWRQKLAYFVGLGGQDAKDCSKLLEKHGFCRKRGYLYGDSFSLRYCARDADLKYLQGPCRRLATEASAYKLPFKLK